MHCLISVIWLVECSLCCNYKFNIGLLKLLLGVKDLPAIGLFRNGQFVQYEGDETSEKQILAWLTDEETLKIIGVIDEVKLFWI